MYPSAYRQRANQYASIQATSHVDDASPHQLIQMLMEGLISRINAAKGAIEQHDFEAKSIFISKAIGIVGGLNEAIDKKQGGVIAENLSDLYAYMSTRLLLASAENSIEKLNEVASLMREVKSAWDAIKS
ncbi:MAG: flagellar export chaperone FliS [Methylococcaceae bacterium]